MSDVVKLAEIRGWPANCCHADMLHKIRRLFTIKSRFEAFLVIFGLAQGATWRGAHYLETYPGFGGALLFAACAGAVFIAGGMILDALEMRRALI
jgi:hypothetical protein